MSFFLYCIRNLVSKKVYIGQSVDPQMRWRAHKRNAGLSAEKRKYRAYIYESMRAHGIENFEFRILGEFPSREAVDVAEVHFIKVYSLAPLGYNIETGGSGGSLSETTRAKISVALKGRGKGRKVSPESKARMSQAQREPSLAATRLMRLKARATEASALLKKLSADPVFKARRLLAQRQPEAVARNSEAQRLAWTRRKAVGIEDRNITGLLKHSAARKESTHCKRGHLLSPDNLFPSALRVGSRSCRACSTLRSRKSQ